MSIQPTAYRWVEYDGIGGSPRVRYADVPPGHLAAQGIVAEPLYDEKALAAARELWENEKAADAMWAARTGKGE